MDRTLNDDLDARLRAARPAAATPDTDSVDTELLARIRRQPIARRSLPRVGRPIALVACATVAALAVVTFGGGPINVGGPDTASSAVTAALQWFDPPAGTVLHTESMETNGARSVRREFWQSVDHPEQQRLVIDAGAGHSYEMAGKQLYDPATNTIYDMGEKAGTAPKDDKALAADDAKKKAKLAGQAAATNDADTKAKQSKAEPPRAKANAAKVDRAGTEVRPAAGSDGRHDPIPAGDPVVAKIRFLLRDGRAAVTGHELHGGVDAWVISLNDDLGRTRWTLWVDRADGRPLEAYDPGRDASEDAQTIRWTTYEVKPAADATISLAQAHPSAQHVSDIDAYNDAEQRLVTTP